MTTPFPAASLLAATAGRVLLRGRGVTTATATATALSPGSSPFAAAGAAAVATGAVGSSARYGRRTFYTTAQEPLGIIHGRPPPPMVSAEEAVNCIRSGDRVFVHSAAAVPQVLVEAMVEKAVARNLHDIRPTHIHVDGHPRYADADMEAHFRADNLFVGANMRQAVNEGRADSFSVHLSEIGQFFHTDTLDVNVALVSVSPPDKHGYCTFGPSVDVTRAAVQNADVIIGQVNKYMPRTFGDGVVHISHFDYLVEGHVPLPEHQPVLSSEKNEVSRCIGKIIAEHLIEDGSTLQMGIGVIPDCVLSQLMHHKNLGVHTEMFSDCLTKLVKLGVINNSKKVVHPGHIVSSFAVGTRDLYDWMDDNPFISMRDASYTNDVFRIALNPKVVAINSAVEIDLTGQVVSDSIGPRMLSGFGGQVDFLRGAARSVGGKPIIALPSMTSKGESRIKTFLKNGAGVVTSRADVHWVCTEYGHANMWGLNRRERAMALISIAHPSVRDQLAKEACEELRLCPKAAVSAVDVGRGEMVYPHATTVDALSALK